MPRRLRLAVALSASAAVLVAAGAVQASTDAAQTVVVSPVPQKKTPNILDGEVNAIAQVGNRIVVGGTFTQVKSVQNGVTYNRSEIFSFDPTTGAVDTSFAPVIAGGEVDTITAAPGGTAVFVGGMFSTVNGTTQKRLVKINLSDGSVDATFKPNVTGSWVEDTQLLGNELYVGGAFTNIGGKAIARLAAVDVNTGVADPNVNVPFTVKRDGTLRVAHFDISPDGTKLVATGTFTQVGGQDRAQIAMLNLTTTPVSVSSWETDRFKPACSPRFDTYIRDVKFSPDGSYFVIGDTGAYSGGPGAGSICDSVSRWESNATGTGVQPTWIDYTGGDSITQLATTGTAVYAGGHQRWMNNPNASDALGPGGVSRMGIAALDPVNGMPFSWNPGRNPRGSGVWAMLATTSGLWVGSDTDYIDGAYHAKLAFLPTTGGETIPTWNTGSAPGTLDMLSSSGITSRSFDGTTVGAASLASSSAFANVRGAFMINGQLYSGWSNGTLTEQPFDGTALGASSTVALNGLTAANFPIGSLTGMFYDASSGRLYYSVSGSSTLYYRYFEPEDNVLGGLTYSLPNVLPAGGVTSMTMVGANLYYVTAGNRLFKIGFANGQTTGAAAQISGAGLDSQDWSGRALFMVAS